MGWLAASSDTVHTFRPQRRVRATHGRGAAFGPKNKTLSEWRVTGSSTEEKLCNAFGGPPRVVYGFLTLRVEHPTRYIISQPGPWDFVHRAQRTSQAFFFRFTSRRAVSWTRLILLAPLWGWPRPFSFRVVTVPAKSGFWPNLCSKMSSA